MSSCSVYTRQMWSQKCGMCVYIMYNIIYWWARTKWEHKIILYMRRASKIGFNTSIQRTHTFRKKHTNTHTHTPIYNNVSRCKYIRSLSLTDSIYHLYTVPVIWICFGLFRFIQREMRSLILRFSALLLFSVHSFNIDIYTHTHVYI